MNLVKENRMVHFSNAQRGRRSGIIIKSANKKSKNKKKTKKLRAPCSNPGLPDWDLFVIGLGKKSYLTATVSLSRVPAVVRET